VQNNRGENTIMKRPKNEPPQRFYVVPIEALLDGVELEKAITSNTDNNNKE
jgi:hypothetical protein